jgi:hypothetical protein
MHGPEIQQSVVLCQPEMLCDWSRNSGPIVSTQTENRDNLELVFWVIHKCGGRIPVILELAF